MADVEIRRTSDDDWTTVRRLRMLALRRDPRAFDAGEAVEAARTETGRRTWTTGTADTPRSVWTATIAGTPVGIVEAAGADGDCRIGFLWVSPPYRGRGVTKLLLDAVEPWAATTGCRQLILGVTADDPAAELYRARGYVPTGDHRTTRSGRREVTMVKPLEPAEPG